MPRSTERERIRAVEVLQVEARERLHELEIKVDAAVFYLKGCLSLVAVLTYHIIGGPYAQAFGDILGSLH